MMKNVFCPPLAEDLLLSGNFFELYPFDGGGYYVNRAMIGTQDDREYARRVLSGALDGFGGLGNLDFGRFERWRSVEKSCWLNRCYFLVPLAKAYRLGGGEELAARVRDVMLSFLRTMPEPRSEADICAEWEYVEGLRNGFYNRAGRAEIMADETDIRYVWYDFQPASRIIHFLYAMYFIASSPSLSDADWEELREGIRRHARVIATGERKCSPLHSPGNHQSVRGLALLYAADFLRGEAEAELFLDEGLRICNYHIENDFFPDGVLREISPSYHIFETWHVRDAFLLSQRCGWMLTPCAGEVLRRASKFIAALNCPDGLSPVINDGYALRLGNFLRSVPDLPSLDTDGGAFALFPDAGLASWNEDGDYVLFDCSRFTGRVSHFHSGKNGLIFYAGGRRFLVDGGCCAYDSIDFELCKGAGGHCSLLIDGDGDAIQRGAYCWDSHPDVDMSAWSDSRISGSLRSDSPAWAGVEWTRELLVGNGLTITDRVSSPGVAELEFVFMLDSEVEAELDDGVVRLRNGTVELVFGFESSLPARVELMPGHVFEEGGARESGKLVFRLKSQGLAEIRFSLI